MSKSENRIHRQARRSCSDVSSRTQLNKISGGDVSMDFPQHHGSVRLYMKVIVHKYLSTHPVNHFGIPNLHYTFLTLLVTVCAIFFCYFGRPTPHIPSCDIAPASARCRSIRLIIYWIHFLADAPKAITSLLAKAPRDPDTQSHPINISKKSHVRTSPHPGLIRFD